MESVFLGLIGAVAGLALTSAMQLLSISTLIWQTFSKLAFTFTLTPAIIL